MGAVAAVVVGVSLTLHWWCFVLGAMAMVAGLALTLQDRSRRAMVARLRVWVELGNAEPERFELEVARVLEHSGWQGVHRRSAAGAGASVLGAIQPDGFETSVYCLQLPPDTPVAAATLRNLLALEALRTADAAFVLTTGSFTPRARTIGARAGLTLVDGHHLSDMVLQERSLAA
jgi:restriction endonuclease Mrr